jgi:hypothetical protein
LAIGLSACFWSIRLVGALALALADSCALGLADWMSTGASRLAKAVSAVPNRDSYCVNLPICGGVFQQVQPICHLNRMSS